MIKHKFTNQKLHTPCSLKLKPKKYYFQTPELNHTVLSKALLRNFTMFSHLRVLQRWSTYVSPRVAHTLLNIFNNKKLSHILNKDAFCS